MADYRFPFGNNEPYYSRRDPESKVPNLVKGVAGLFATGAAITASGFIPFGQGNLFDQYYKAARVAGHAVPLGFFASLRIPEFISPFTSPHFQSGGLGHITWGPEFLSSRDTLDALSNKLRIPAATLQSYGVGTTASLRYERNVGWRGILGQGTLSVQQPGGPDRVLSRNTSIMERAHTLGDPFAPRANINPLAEAMSAVMYGDRVDPRRTFIQAGTTPGDIIGAHRWMPIHSIVGDIGRPIDRLGFFRGALAWEAQRPLRAIETLTDNIPIFGEALRPLMQRIGLPKGSTATKTYLGLAGFAAKIATAGVAVSQYNWWMRYHSDDSILKKETGYLTSASVGAFAAGWLSRTQRTGAMSSQLASIKGRNAAIAGVAVFMGQNLLPGFEKGIYAGSSQTLSSLSVMRARVGEVSGISGMRRKLEETFPGISSFSTSIFAGGAGYVASEFMLHGTNAPVRFAQHLRADLGTTYGGIFSTLRQRGFTSSLDAVYEAWEKAGYDLPATGTSFAQHKANIQAGTAPKLSLIYQRENDLFAEQMTSQDKWLRMRGIQPGTPGVVIPPNVGQYVNETFSRKAQLTLEHIFSNKFAKYKGAGAGAVLFLGGLLSHRLLTGGLLGSLDTPEQLQKQASGEEWVGVRKSRFWGAGGTPFAGGKISHFRPSTNALIQSDAEAKSVWGEETEELSPLRRFFLKNFTYHLEEKHYYDRPYPISSPAGSELPIIGDIFGATIGSLIKPPKLAHVDQWARVSEDTGEARYLTVPSKLESNPSLRIGGTGIGAPMSPAGLGFALSETQYKLRELQGLWGFAKNTLQEMYTGEETFTPNVPVLAESSQMSSAIDRYWDLELGGSFGLTEIVRRFLPRDRLQVRNRYNPIINQLPQWLPQELRRGDPYATQGTGYARLPGPGYESLYPELKGTHPESYPLWHQYQILGSVAPYSEEFRKVRGRLYGMRKAGHLSEDINSMIDRVDFQVQEQRQRRNFYQEGPENADDPAIQKMARNGYFGLLNSMKMIAAPLEYLTPFRPFQKFLPVGKAIDDYENNFIYGTETAMWKPSAAIREYLGPSFLAGMRNIGYNLVPPDVEQKRAIDEYFDKLTYYKYMMLSMKAKESGSYQDAYEYEKFAHKTVYGVNPFGNPLSIYGVLPEAEKSHFDAFSATSDPRERERLMQLLPENQKDIWSAIWAKRDGIAPHLKGSQVSNQYMAEYNASNLNGKMSYTDFAKMQDLEGYFNDKGLPREDFIGYHSDVDLNDVKLLYVKKEGCLLPNTKLIVDLIKEVEAKDLTIQHNLIDSNGENNKIEEIYIKNYSGLCKKISLKAVPTTPIFITNCHHLPYKSNNKIKYGTISELKRGDLLSFPSYKFKKQLVLDIEVYKTKNGNAKKFYNWPSKVEISEELAEVIGWFLAEGSYLKANKKIKGIEFGLNLSKEKDIAINIARVLSKNFGGNPRIRERPDKNCIIVSYYSVPIGNLFYALVGEYSTTKKLSSLLLSLSPKLILCVLKGWQEGDGWETKKELIFSTSSEQLAYQAWYLLNSLGYKPKWQKIKPSKLSKNYSYRIRLGKINDILNFKNFIYSENLLFWISINSLETFDYTGIVYDFRISNPHLYLTSCGIVHNSDIHDFNMWESQQSLLARKPYLEGAEEAISINDNLGWKSQATQMISRINPGPSHYSHQLMKNNQNGLVPSSSVTYINDDRSAEIAYKFRQHDER